MQIPVQQFREAMARRHIIAPEHVIADGKLHRCDAEGKNGKSDAAYLLHLDGLPAGGFENHRDGLGWENWKANASPDVQLSMTPERIASMEAARRQRQQAMQERHRAAQAQAARIWRAAATCTVHPYLTRKGIGAHGTRTIHAEQAREIAPTLSGQLTGDLLVIPMRDTDGLLHNLQLITADGTKRPMTGARKQGCYFGIGKPGTTICMAEGFATAASIYEATGHAVAVAFDAGNLPDVAQALRGKYPNTQLILCADDDTATNGNPGVTKATQAAREIGGFIAVPDFGSARPDGATDFNDLHQAQGLEAVRRCIHAASTDTSISTSTNTAKHDGVHFELTPRGVYFYDKDKEGNNKSTWICSPLHILAKTRDHSSDKWGRLLQWLDDDGKPHQWAMPAEMLQGDGLDLRKALARQGLSIAPGKRARDLLASYLQTWSVKERARCVDRLGWHGGVYLTPGQTIGTTAERVVFQNEHAIEPALSTQGTIEHWRENVAALAVNNSRLAFAISVALAAPLAELAGEDSGGFHLRGASSSGKSTVLKVAASVWGKPEQYCRLWRTTTNGLEGLAALHNDGLLILDELSQIDPRQAGDAAYLLANGQGKTRANRTGAARHAAQWRLLFLSAGEQSLTDLMAQAGKRANAGQEIRLADMAADAGQGMGAFEDLHQHNAPPALALALKDAANRYYGTAGIEWLQYLAANRRTCAASVTERVAKFTGIACPDNASGQVVRVARRFALIAVAGELATECGLTGWPYGEANKAAYACFDAWLAGFGGDGNREARALLEQVRAFFEAHGESRFDDEKPTAGIGRHAVNRVGFYRHNTKYEREYLVLPEAFKREICKGFDASFAAKTLIDAGWLIPGKDGRATQKPRIDAEGKPVRCYVFNTRMFD